MINFKKYAEKRILEESKTDIFGFSKERTQEPEIKSDGLPINSFNIEELLIILSKIKLGIKNSKLDFVNQIVWGNNPGAIRLKISPNLHCKLQKKGLDLEGNQVWCDKKYMIINRTGFGGHEEEVASHLINLLQEIDLSEIDSTNRNYSGLESLTIKMASKIRQTARDAFVFEKTKKVSDYNYVIQMSLRGGGTGMVHSSQSKIIENQTNISYDKYTGIIRVFNNNIGNGPEGKSWTQMETDLDCNFFPSQPEEEIISVASTFLKYY